MTQVLDLFCCAGGAARGFLDAGATIVVGVDINPQPRYAGTHFIQGDCVHILRRLVEGHFIVTTGGDAFYLSDFDFIHASPPCQAHSDLQKQSKIQYADFIGPTRHLLKMSGRPYTIENVEGAPLINPVMLCGASSEFPDLRVIRHRLFESNVKIVGTPCPNKHPLVFTYDKRKTHYGQLDQNTAYVQVTGGGNCTVTNKRAALGVPWMTGREANECIPPAFAEYVARQIFPSTTNHQED